MKTGRVVTTFVYRHRRLALVASVVSRSRRIATTTPHMPAAHREQTLSRKSRRARLSRPSDATGNSRTWRTPVPTMPSYSAASAGDFGAMGMHF